MNRDLWSGLAVFAEIVEAGSFTSAAKRVGLSPSALSHAMRTVEAKLGVRLLDRTTRSLSPTDAGRDLLQRLRPAMASVREAVGALDMARDVPAGRVRVNAHRPAAVYAVLPKLSALARSFPDITVELVVNDGMVDIVAEGFDCGVRHEGALQGDMISARISDRVPLLFAASPDYLRTHGEPRTPEDLGGHRCICYRHSSSGAIHRWEFDRGGTRFEQPVPVAFVTNDADILRDAAITGLGVVCLLRDQARSPVATGALVEVLRGWAPDLPPNHIYYPSRRQPTAVFRAFLEALRV